MNTNAATVHFRPSRHRDPIQDCPQPDNAFREVVQPLPSKRPSKWFEELNEYELERAREYALSGPGDGCVYFWFGGNLLKNFVGGAA